MKIIYHVDYILQHMVKFPLLSFLSSYAVLIYALPLTSSSSPSFSLFDVHTKGITVALLQKYPKVVLHMVGMVIILLIVSMMHVVSMISHIVVVNHNY